jgi:23S rRNA (uracil1939-C5)-methyltransferase
VGEIELFANAEDSQLLVEVTAGGDCRRAALRQWGEDLREAMPEIAGVVVFSETQPGKPATAANFFTLGADHLIYRTEKTAYRVSAGSFFQTNRYLIDELVRIVTQGQSGELALDLYAGVGLFSTALCDMRHIISVESSQTSSGDLAYNQPANGEVVQATTEQYLDRGENKGRVGKGAVLTHTLHKPDLAVVDPPRMGLGERVAQSLATLGAPRVFYVSCDPATLARDLITLLASGYRIQQLHLVDLFPQTFHLETVVHLAR